MIWDHKGFMSSACRKNINRLIRRRVKAFIYPKAGLSRIVGVDSSM